MQILRCSNPDCGKRSSQDELRDTDGACPYCGCEMFYKSTFYTPKSDDDIDEEEEPRTFDW